MSQITPMNTIKYEFHLPSTKKLTIAAIMVESYAVY